MARSKDLKTSEAVVAFAHNLFEPQERDNGKKQYGCSLLFKKGVSLASLEQLAVDAAKEEWGDKAIEWIKDGIIKSPFLDGDGKQGVNKKTMERHPGFAGTTFIRCISGADFKPKVVDGRVLPIVDKSELPSGSKGFAVVNAFTWENKENGKGISFGISLFQRSRKAEGEEVLGGGGGPAAEQFFEAIEDSGDAPASTKSGEGAAGLFG